MTSLTTEFFAGLQAMNSLEILRLRTLPEEMLFEDQGAHSVELASCQVVDLEGDERTVAKILEVLRLPSNIHLRVHASFRELSVPAPSPSIIRAIRALLDARGHDTAGYRSAVFEHCCEHLNGHKMFFPGYLKSCWRLRAYRCSSLNKETVSDLNSDNAPDLDVCLKWTTHELQARESSTEHGEFFGLASAVSSIQELHLVSPPDGSVLYTPNVLRHHFKSWTSVERLRITGAEFARRALDELNSSPGQSLLFPSLTELALRDILAAQRLGSGGNHDAVDLGKDLVTMVRARHEAGASIQRLEMSGNETLDPDTVEELKTFTTLRSC
ncbi:hypothetical protein PENSPDRAFT_26450 [Peniophora sp. CONT]|nr:hypothetical protein PENSPDRAFT_26450 [Peniophora sp. CONT]